MNDYLIQSGDTLSGLARQYGTSVSELQRLNPSITNPDLIRAGETIRVPGQTPVSSPETIQGQQPLTLPTQDELDQRTGLQRILAEMQEQTREREAAFEESQRNLRSSMEAITRFPERAQEIQEEEGVADAMRGLDEIDSLIASRSRAIERQIELLETQGISGGMISRQQNQMYREGVRELADLSLIQNARAGRLETAQLIARQRIELELMPLQQQLEFDKFFYSENKEFLTASQNREFQLKIAQDEREYQAEREKQQNISNLMITVAQSGGTPDLVSEISRAESYEDALEIATEQLGVPFRLQVEQQEFQNRMAQASLNLQQQQLAQARAAQEFNQNIKLAEMGDLNAIKKLGITLPDGSTPSDEELAYARQYAQTGQIPTGMPKGMSFSRVQQLAQELPKQPGQVMGSATGVTPTNVSASIIDGYSTVYSIIDKLHQLSEIQQELPRGVTAGAEMLFSGDTRKAIRDYTQLRNRILEEWKTMDYGTRSALGLEEEIQGRLPIALNQGALSTRVGAQRINNAISSLTTTLQNSLSAQGLVMNGFTQIPGTDIRVGDIYNAGDGTQWLMNFDGSGTQIGQ